ncbi:MAG: sulfotransferase [Actinomycetota bacterium]|nr:sulfotransferase [Actinomycetota bacterium]
MNYDPKQTYLVIGPPRSASTAFSRVFWNNPKIRYYVHEPYEATYYQSLDNTEHAVAALADPVDLSAVAGTPSGDGVLVKEMSFQVSDNLDELLGYTTNPVVFLIRDPRLTISSRRRVKEAQQQPLDFPLVETGWEDLVRQIDHCRAHGVDYLITDSADFRAEPELVFRRIFAAWGLDFDVSQLTWEPQPDMALSNHRTVGVDHFFTRVLNSKQLEPPVEQPGAVEDFPETNGLRAHVEWAMARYRELRADPSFIDITSEVG